VRRPSPVATIDRDALQRTLQAHRWRRADAAKALGVSRSTLWRWIREAGLE
jgi:transcriptional regulator of acetoin/glycerol metabolism